MGRPVIMRAIKRSRERAAAALENGETFVEKKTAPTTTKKSRDRMTKAELIAELEARDNAA